VRRSLQILCPWKPMSGIRNYVKSMLQDQAVPQARSGGMYGLRSRLRTASGRPAQLQSSYILVNSTTRLLLQNNGQIHHKRQHWEITYRTSNPPGTTLRGHRHIIHFCAKFLLTQMLVKPVRLQQLVYVCVEGCWRITPHDRSFAWVAEVTLRRLQIPQKWESGNGSSWMIVNARTRILQWPNIYS